MKSHKEYDYRESEDLYEMACEWIDDNNFEKAEECLLKAIGLNPNFIYVYVTLAEVYEKQQKLHEAIDYLKRAFKLDETFDKLPYIIARLYFAIGDLKLALKFIDQALELAYMPEYEELKERIDQQGKMR